MICQYCGKEFDGHKRKYCSTECRNRRNSVNRVVIYQHKCEICGIEWESKNRDSKRCKKCANKIVYTYICKYCGKEYHPRAKQYNTYCSRECSFADKVAKPKIKADKPPVVCVICGKEFKGNKSAKYCSDDCRKEKARMDSYYSNTAKSTECRWCGIVFIPAYKADTYVYCCDEHLQLAKRKQQKIHDKNNPNRKLHKGGVSKAKRQRIYLRDGCTCQLCGKKMKMDKADTLGFGGKPHPLAPTVDHIIPKSIAKEMGWTKQQMNDETNLQAAHFKCNLDKGNSVANEQLLLFG